MFTVDLYGGSTDTMRKIFFTVILFGILLLQGCTKDKPEVLFNISQLHNGDAKLLSDRYVVTSVDGKLTFISPEGKIINQDKNINVNWCDVCEEDRFIVYGNWQKQIGICRYDENYNVVGNEIVMEIQEDLGIDPAVCKADGRYYMTVTHISGAINNGDINTENGTYTVKLYVSDDLKNWTEVSEVVSAGNNLEDIDLNYYDGRLFVTYEKETVDKKESSINLLISDDMGESFSENIVLIEANADNEPAAFVHMNDRYCLYYSSDIENPGGTYEKSKVYVAEFDEKFNQTVEPRELELYNNEGDLLYDVFIDNSKIYCLFAKHYLSDCDLVLECTK